ncbi:hypothetical protein [Niallia sp. JL1B1071]|uniref:hypothetical protein n=1 Tax=Niallia tiangongensis TaxID=3237105 RepID=UPI0037DCE161
MEGAVNKAGKGKNIWNHWYDAESNCFFDNVGPETTSNFQRIPTEIRRFSWGLS